DAIMEAAAAGIGLIVCITEGIPLYDMVRARAFVAAAGVKLIGPNCPGLVTAGQAKVGIIPNHINREGPVGIGSRSGNLPYAIISGSTGTAASKLKALTQAGAQVCDTIEEVVAAAAAAVGQPSSAVHR